MVHGTEVFPLHHGGLSLRNAVLDFVALPAHLIIPASKLSPSHGSVTVEVPPCSPGDLGSSFRIDLGAHPTADFPRSPQLPPTVAAVAKLAAFHMKKDRVKQANQTIGSKGVAPRTLDTADCASRMHPFYGDDPVLPLAPPARLEIDEATSIGNLRSQADDTQASSDVFGWSANLLACVVFAKPTVHGRSPAEVLARLKHTITVADVPDAVAVVLTAGALNMINKVDEEVNARARAEGATPQYRPVNAGTNILKQALNDAAHTK